MSKKRLKTEIQNDIDELSAFITHSRRCMNNSSDANYDREDNQSIWEMVTRMSDRRAELYRELANAKK